jgi:ribosomal-protein-alanine N-acetyltransferase
MEIVLSQCVLRNWMPEDVESLAHHANNRNIWRNLRDRFPHPYATTDAEEWIADAGTADPTTNFAIVVDGVAAGGIGFILGDDVFRRSAEIGYWLGEEFWGRGIMTEAVRGMTDYAFANYDLCRIWAGVFEWNPASMRVLTKAGYELEGLMRKAVTKDGETLDENIYSIMQA